MAAIQTIPPRISPITDTRAPLFNGLYQRGFVTADLDAAQERPGRIIALGTIGSEHPVPRGNVAYGSSKAALNQMCRSLPFEHAADKITVSAILPGSNPERHPGGYISGQTFVIDGGFQVG